MYVLLILTAVYGGTTPTSFDFGTKALCEEAASWYLQKIETVHVGGYGIAAKCMPKMKDDRAHEN